MLTPVFDRAHFFLGSSPIAGLLLACVCYFPIPSAFAGPENEQLTPELFLQKYRKAIIDLDKLYENVNTSGVSVAPLPTQFAYISSRGNEKLHLRREQPKFFDRAVVSMANHKFMVRRTTAEGSYFLEDLFDAEEQWGVMIDYRTRIRKAAYCLGGMRDFPEFVKSPGFAISEVSRVSEAGVDLLNAVFEYTPSGEGPKLKGWFRVIPDLRWVIQSYEYELRRPILRGKRAGQELASRSEGRVNYKLESGSPVPTEIYTKRTLERRKDAIVDQFTVSKFLLEIVPPEEFTLAAFGLGDVEKTARQLETRNNYWTTVLVLTAFLASFLLFRVGRNVQKRRAHEGKITRVANQSTGSGPSGQTT